MLDIVNDPGFAHDDPAQGGKGLAKSAHHQVHLIREAEMGCRAAPVGQHAERMRIVHHQPCAIALARVHDIRQRSDVSAHTKDAIHHHQGGLALQAFQSLPQVRDVVVPKAPHLAIGELAAIHNTGVIVAVRHDIIAATDQGGDHTQVHAHAGAEHQASLFAHKVRQLLLELVVHRQVAVEKARTGTAGAIAPDGLQGRFAHARIGC